MTKFFALLAVAFAVIAPYFGTPLAALGAAVLSVVGLVGIAYLTLLGITVWAMLKGERPRNRPDGRR